MQRCLLRNGFKRGKKNGKIILKPETISWRNSYIQALLQNRNLPENERYREVYSDELYVHQHYSRTDNSLYDPNDDQDLQVRKAHKRRRIFFVVAIQASHCGSPASLVENSLWSFIPNQKNGHRGDYHKVFNSQNFATWFKNQLMLYLSYSLRTTLRQISERLGLEFEKINTEEG